MKKKAKKRWSSFYGPDGREKTGGGVNEIPPLTDVEMNFLSRVTTESARGILCMADIVLQHRSSSSSAPATSRRETLAMSTSQSQRRTIAQPPMDDESEDDFNTWVHISYKYFGYKESSPTCCSLVRNSGDKTEEGNIRRSTIKDASGSDI